MGALFRAGACFAARLPAASLELSDQWVNIKPVLQVGSGWEQDLESSRLPSWIWENGCKYGAKRGEHRGRRPRG